MSFKPRALLLKICRVYLRGIKLINAKLFGLRAMHAQNSDGMYIIYDIHIERK